MRHISRLLFAFQDRHPDIDIDLNLTDERVDLVREGVDIALRLGPLTDSTLRLRPLGRSRRALMASPDYLARRGRPAHPRDLAGHDIIRMSNVAGSDTLVLHGPDGEVEEVAAGGRFRVDHGLGAREAMAAGRGIGPTHHWLMDDLLATGGVEIVLPGHSPPPVPFNMLIVPERAGIARVRLLADFLVDAVAGIPGMDR
ncbi:substrate binding domain-containing protein [Nitrospirillum sp. BR 11752]|uniref:substrate binding domain-containing protein n=1 Tax=Nitrospirillum sp. BR 11752 TaxID=3104293 RepID=UPI003FA5E6FA